MTTGHYSQLMLEIGSLTLSLARFDLLDFDFGLQGAAKGLEFSNYLKMGYKKAER